MSNGQIVRVEKIAGFTVMSNVHLRDKALSLKAKGLMSFMLSLPPEWDYSINGLVACGIDGKAAVASALNELEAHGYLVREQGRNAGKFGETNYILYKNADLSRFSPITDFPATVFPEPENQIQINTDINKDLINNNRGAEPETKVDPFEEFWKLYPKKSSKPMARTAWNKLNPNADLVAAIMASVEQHRLSDEQWKKEQGKYIPMPSTFLNQRRWEDKVDLGPIAQASNKSEPPPIPTMQDAQARDYILAETERYEAEAAKRKAEARQRADEMMARLKNEQRRVV